MGILKDLEAWCDDPYDCDGVEEICEARGVFEQIEAMLPELESRPATKGVARQLRVHLGLPKPAEETPKLCDGDVIAFWDGPYMCGKCSFAMKPKDYLNGPKHVPVLPLKGNRQWQR